MEERMPLPRPPSPVTCAWQWRAVGAGVCTATPTPAARSGHAALRPHGGWPVAKQPGGSGEAGIKIQERGKTQRQVDTQDPDPWWCAPPPRGVRLRRRRKRRRQQLLHRAAGAVVRSTQPLCRQVDVCGRGLSLKADPTTRSDIGSGIGIVDRGGGGGRHGDDEPAQCTLCRVAQTEGVGPPNCILR